MPRSRHRPGPARHGILARSIARAASRALVEAGVITPAVRLRHSNSELGELHKEMSDVLVSVRPDVMVIEELWSSYKNPTDGRAHGSRAAACICLAAHTNGVRVRHLAHATVKRALTGSGAARKESGESDGVHASAPNGRSRNLTTLATRSRSHVALSNIEQVEATLTPRDHRNSVHTHQRHARRAAAIRRCCSTWAA